MPAEEAQKAAHRRLFCAQLPVDSGKGKEVFRAVELHLRRHRGMKRDGKFREILILSS